METIRYFRAEQLKEMTANRRQEFSALFQKLKKKKPKNLDAVVHALHREAFDQFNCLDCANCCSGISPIVTDKDAERLAKSQKMKPAAFIGQYLTIDEDHDFVFQKTPCPFLMADKHCCVYENRPRACREYPHTDRSRLYQILDLTYKNCEICPVVYAIADELTKTDW
ncbi:YkgJ family cysteine cluster protein [Gaoshiqia sp. Z1-71]|uniref:YkgJ family cysteine cluster protein n=1 Tax=Gaoshiqia hydrogeniformans TaxID=3290090 RepID=UPI003BF7A078